MTTRRIRVAPSPWLGSADLERTQREAAQLLETLLHARAASDRLHSDRDPIRRLTGHSALDRAVDATRAMLAELDDLARHRADRREEVTVLSTDRDAPMPSDRHRWRVLRPEPVFA